MSWGIGRNSRYLGRSGGARYRAHHTSLRTLSIICCVLSWFNAGQFASSLYSNETCTQLCCALFCSSTIIVHNGIIWFIKNSTIYLSSSLSMWQSHDCASASEVTLKFMGNIDQYQEKQQSTNHVHISWQWIILMNMDKIIYGSGHEGAALSLPGFAIIW